MSHDANGLTTYGKGKFNLGGVLPPVKPNVQLHKGWFEETLPGFLDEHPDIAESAVVGTPPGKHGQRVVAFIELEDGHQLDMKEASLWATERIAEFKTPDEWILVDALPRNAVGKLDRAELHRRSKELFPDG